MTDRAKCSAHGHRRCTWCSLNPANCVDRLGRGGCSTYADDGMHWDTCPNRVSGLDKAQALGIPLPHLGDGPRSQFVTVDSGQREEFESGARRDTQDGKPRYDLIAPAPLKRVAELMARGAVKYGDHNWMKGMPASRFLASLMRHVEAYRLGDRDEDHLAAAVFNALAIMHFEGTNWDDLNPS